MIAPFQFARVGVSAPCPRPAQCAPVGCRTFREASSRTRRKTGPAAQRGRDVAQSFRHHGNKPALLVGLQRTLRPSIHVPRAEAESSDQELFALHEELLQQVHEQ